MLPTPRVLGTALLLCLSAVSAVAQEVSPSNALDAEAGRKLFGMVCAGCHGAEGEGGERGPDIVSNFRARRRSKEELTRIIREGIPGRGMPALALPEDQTDQIVAFVSLFTQPAARNPAVGDAAAGEAYFFGAGGCASCHSVAGRGGFGGPPLSNIAEARTTVEIERSLREPGQRIAGGYETARLRLRKGGELHGFVAEPADYLGGPAARLVSRRVRHLLLL